MTGDREEIGVAVVGLGVGESHARAYAESPRTRLRWLHDHDREKAGRLADEVGAEGVAEGFEEILVDPRVGIVSIASYDADHAKQVEAALDAGKHVFVEKPMCRTTKELSRIHRAWQRGGSRLKVSSNLVLRAAPLYRWLRDRVARDEIGTVYAFDGDYLYGRLRKITEGWRSKEDDYSVMLGGGIHLVDLMLWVTGERPTHVAATGTNVATRGTPFRYDDMVAATFTFPSGLVGRITANFGCVHPHQHVLRVFGTDATFIHDDAGPRWYRSRDPARRAERLTMDRSPPEKGALIPDFIDTVWRDRDPPEGPGYAFDLITVCVAADEAACKGTRMEIEYL